MSKAKKFIAAIVTMFAAITLCGNSTNVLAAADPAVIVYKEDGSVQCEAVKPRTPDEDAAALMKIGATKICGKANVQGPMIYATQCGLPTGRVNAVAIKKEDWEKIESGFVGTLGFRVWPQNTPLPKIDIDASCQVEPATPTQINELKGMRLRVYKSGDALTEDYRIDRVNIEVNTEGKIVKVWFG